MERARPSVPSEKNAKGTVYRSSHNEASKVGRRLVGRAHADVPREPGRVSDRVQAGRLEW